MKKIATVVLAILMLFTTFSLAACGGTDDLDPPGVSTYTFEAEGVDLNGQHGHGQSNNEEGCGMIQGKNTASIRAKQNVLNSISNEYFVGFFGTTDVELVFNITSSAAVEQNTLILRLASEWGTMQIDQTVIKIEVNGEFIEFNAFSLSGDSNNVYGMPFADFTLSSKIDLVEGDNVIKIIAQGKTKGSFQDIGPGVDCIKIKSTATLEWESLWEDNEINVKNEV